MAAPSPKELIALRQSNVLALTSIRSLWSNFRDAISSEGIQLNERGQTDMALIAWLRARDLDISKALDMLKKSCVWREKEDIDNILDWKPPDDYKKEFAYGISGRDAEGCPVLVMPFGKWDTRKAVQAGEKDIWLRHFDQIFAVTREDMYETNKTLEPGVIPVSQCVLIVDMEGFSFRQLTSVYSIQTIVECVSRFEGNYPETLKAAYAICAPSIMSLFFSIIKPMISARTLAKVEIYSDEKKWKPKLLKNIPESQLPPKYGGTNTDVCRFLAEF